MSKSADNDEREGETEKEEVGEFWITRSMDSLLLYNPNNFKNLYAVGKEIHINMLIKYLLC